MSEFEFISVERTTLHSAAFIREWWRVPMDPEKISPGVQTCAPAGCRVHCTSPCYSKRDSEKPLKTAGRLVVLHKEQIRMRALLEDHIV